VKVTIMRKLLLYRLGIALPILLAVSLFTFVLVSLSPGDAASTILGASATTEQLAQLREKLGLDLPLYQQYFNWLQGAVHLDFGQSLLNRQDVLAAIGQRVWPTVSLMGATMVVTVILGLWLGIAGAVRGGIVGRLVDILSMLGVAVPNFLLAFILTVWLAVWLHLLPPGGYVPLGESFSGWSTSLIMPVICLSLFSTGFLAKQVRASLSDALQSEYVFNLVANGFSRRSVVMKHALKNGALPILATAGVLFAGLLSGTILIESIFYIPGLGSLAVSASMANDLPVVQGVIVIFTASVIVINLLVDVAYGFLNPRLGASR
jgi:peptide/nickel transport system permease protein